MQLQTGTCDVRCLCASEIVLRASLYRSGSLRVPFCAWIWSDTLCDFYYCYRSTQAVMDRCEDGICTLLPDRRTLFP